jgi:hypothetical protein
MSVSKCRLCSISLTSSFVDLGMSPLSNSYLESVALNRMEPFYPLHAYVCRNCLLVQLEEFESPQAIFSNYAYFSSYSDAWLKHSEDYADEMVKRFGFDRNSQIIEIASNDGYLLQFFKKKGIPILGIEPAKNVARVALQKGIPTVVKFFGVQPAKELVDGGTQADLLLGNNVLAHVPDLNDFVSAMKILLKGEGIITMEFPHLLMLIMHRQFDTIYHEHFSYFSFMVVKKLFANHGLVLFDVDELATHGGSLRIYARHSENKKREITSRVKELEEKEKKFGLDRLEPYLSFEEKVKATKRHLLNFLIEAKEKRKSIVCYGAPAKGNTLLNYCGIRTDFIDYTVDLSPYKQGHFLPGSHIKVYHPDRIKETRPHFLLILPWNLKDEIIAQMAYVREWGCKFVIPIPEVEVIP